MSAEAACADADAFVVTVAAVAVMAAHAEAAVAEVYVGFVDEYVVDHGGVADDGDESNGVVWHGEGKLYSDHHQPKIIEIQRYS